MTYFQYLLNYEECTTNRHFKIQGERKKEKGRTAVKKGERRETRKRLEEWKKRKK